MGPYERNHDGAALGPSMHITEEDQRSVYPYTVTGSVTVSDPETSRRRTQMLQTTYLYLSVAVFGCMAGAWLGSHSKSFLMFFFDMGLLGFFATLFLLNMVPHIALNVAEKRPRWAVPALAFDGFVAGLVMSPLVFLGLHMSGAGENGGDLVSTAVVVTGAIFASITAYVHLNKAVFKPRTAVMWGLAGFVLACLPLSLFLHSSLLSMAISLAIGLLGAYQLAVGTSAIVNNPHFDSPARGALILFAGVFNTFQAVLSLLLSGGSRD